MQLTNDAIRLTPRTAASLAIVLALVVGCGTTRSTDTGRSATEQLLISDAIDRAVETVNFSVLRGQTVYLDDSRLGDAVDREYLVSTLRQHLLASGCALRDKAEDAEFVVEARAGAIGTDRNDLLFGVPSMNVPQILPAQPTPAAIPEIPLAKRRDQRGVAKIAVFAYHRQTGAPVWQSGLAFRESSSNDVWILGAGPFQSGTIYDGTEFAGQAIGSAARAAAEESQPLVALDDEQRFATSDRLAKWSAPEKAASERPESVTVAEPAQRTDLEVSSPATVDSAPATATTAVTATPDNLSPETPTQSPYTSLFTHPVKKSTDGLASQGSGGHGLESVDRYGAPPTAGGVRGSW